MLDLDFTLNEPADGIVANLLGIEGRPPVALALHGEGPLAATGSGADARCRRAARADRTRRELRQQADGLGFDRRCSHGPIASLIPPQFRDFFGAETKLARQRPVQGCRRPAARKARSRQRRAHASRPPGDGADGFLQRLKLDANIADATAAEGRAAGSGRSNDGRTGRPRSCRSARAATRNGAGSLDVWISSRPPPSRRSRRADHGRPAPKTCRTPAERHISFALTARRPASRPSGPMSPRRSASRSTLDIDGDWNAGAADCGSPRRCCPATGFSVSLAGDIADLHSTATSRSRRPASRPSPTLAGRDLSGALDLDAAGAIEPIGGAFDLTIDGRRRRPRASAARPSTICCRRDPHHRRVARGKTGIVADKLRIFNDQTVPRRPTAHSPPALPISISISRSPIWRCCPSVPPAGSPPAGRAKGSDGLIGLTFSAEVPSGTLVDKTLARCRPRLRGHAAERRGQRPGHRQRLLDSVRDEARRAPSAVAGEGARLGDIDFSAGATRITGDVTQAVDGRLYRVSSSCARRTSRRRRRCCSARRAGRSMRISC